MTNYVDTVAEAIIRQLKEGTAPWQRPWRAGGRYVPYNPTTDKAYRGMNAIWLMSRGIEQGYSDQRWLTYRQAEKDGAHVRRGEKGTVVQYWKWQDRETVTDDQGQPVLDGQGTAKQNIRGHERPQVFSAVVFNAEQIEGLAPVALPEPLPAWESNEQAEAILKNSGASIRHEDGDRAFYRVSTDVIVLPSRERFSTADSYYATSLHELGHWTGHPSRLARDLSHPFGSEGYAKEELRAEIASMMLGDELEIGHDPSQHVAYVKSWIKALEEDHREIFRAASAAEKIKAYVMQYQREHVQAIDETERGSAGTVILAGEGVETQPPDYSEPLTELDGAPKLGHGEGWDNQPMTRTYLAVPYREKDEARKQGARWDKVAKAWYAPEGVSLEKLHRWLPTSPHGEVPLESPQDEFARALKAAGLQLPGVPLMDGTLRRVPVEGDKGTKRSGAYVGFLDRHPAGYFNNFKAGVEMNWKSQVPVPAVTSAVREQLTQDAREAQTAREIARAQIQAAAAERAQAILRDAPLASGNHPYLVNKGIGGNAHDLTVDTNGNLLIAVQDIEGHITSLQRISPEGEKSFLKGGRIEQSHAKLSGWNITNAGTLVIAEGYATAATIERNLDLPVVVAFSAGNLAPVAQAYRDKFPDLVLVIAGDNDHRKPRELGLDGRPKANVGKEKAEDAAQRVGGYVLLPPFRPEESGNDWNDFRKLRGAEETERVLRDGISVAKVHANAMKEHFQPSPVTLTGLLATTPGDARLEDERLFDADRRRLQDAHRTRHDGETVAETIRLQQTSAVDPAPRAELDQVRNAAQAETVLQDRARNLGRGRRL